MSEVFTTTRRVEFSDTDTAGLIHFTCLYRFMEQAEHEWFRSLGLKVFDEQSDGTVVSWPRVSAACDFHAPAHFEDQLTIRVSLGRLGRRSLALESRFWRDETPIASGAMKSVCCRIADGQPIESIDVPEAIAAAINTAAEDGER